MVLRITQHCTPCIRSWFLFHALDHELCDCRQSNVFTRVPSFAPWMENVVPLFGYGFQLMVYLNCPTFESRILTEVLELRSVESEEEQVFLQFAACIVRRHCRARYQANGKSIFCTI